MRKRKRERKRERERERENEKGRERESNREQEIMSCIYFIGHEFILNIQNYKYYHSNFCINV
jgi:hypothetical protein